MQAGALFLLRCGFRGFCGVANDSGCTHRGSQTLGMHAGIAGAPSGTCPGRPACIQAQLPQRELVALLFCSSTLCAPPCTPTHSADQTGRLTSDMTVSELSRRWIGLLGQRSSTAMQAGAPLRMRLRCEMAAQGLDLLPLLLKRPMAQKFHVCALFAITLSDKIIPCACSVPFVSR